MMRPHLKSVGFTLLLFLTPILPIAPTSHLLTPAALAQATDPRKAEAKRVRNRNLLLSQDIPLGQNSTGDISIPTNSPDDIILTDPTASPNRPTKPPSLQIPAAPTDPRLGEADRLGEQGEKDYEAQQYQAAIRSWEKALTLYRQLKDRRGEGQALSDLGRAYGVLGEYQRALEFHQQALVISRELRNRQAEGFDLRNVGGAYYDLMQYPKAIEFYQQALTIARELRNREAESINLSSLGDAYDSLRQYQRALESYQQALAISRELKDRQAEGFDLKDVGDTFYRLGQYQQAIDYYQQALPIFQDKRNRNSEASTLLNLGVAYGELLQYDRAIGYYQQALPIYQAVKNRNGEALALLNLGITYADLYQYDRAIGYYQQALSIYQAVKDRNEEARTLLNLGVTYADLYQYDRAISYYQQALPIYQAVQDRNGEANALNNLGIAYASLSQGDLAINYYQKALSIYQAVKDRNGEAKALNNLGDAYLSFSQYDRAISYFQQALPIYQSVKDREGEANALMNLGIAYRYLSQYDRAISYYQQALPIFQSVKDRNGEANTLTNLGLAYDFLSQYDRAINYYQQALPIFQAVQDRNGEAKALVNLGNAYRSLSQYDRAIGYYEQALAIFQALKDRNSEAVTMAELGTTYVSLSQYDRAISYYQQALPIFQAVKERNGEALALNNWGVALYELGQFAEAEKRLYASIALKESIRADLSSDQNKVSIFEEQANSYRILQRVLIAQSKVEQALEVAERGRARAFVELLQRRLQGSPLTPLSKGGAKPSLQNPLFQGGQGGSRSLLAQTPSPAIKPIAITEIKQIAKDQNATLVQYSIIPDQKQGESLYIWVVKPSGQIAFQQVNLKTALKGKTLDELVLGGREDIGDSRGRGIGWQENTTIVNQAIASQANQAAQRNPNLQTLHEVLIAPIAQHLPTDPNQRVIFVPQGGLFLVPFPALQAKDLTYLIDKHTILTAPAIQVLQLTRQQRQGLAPGRSPLGNALIVGNPVMPPLTLVPGQPPRKLSNLPASAQEATAIAPLLKTTALIGAQATKSTVVKQMKTARLIHLATHGIYDSQQGLQSGVVLAADGTGQFNDGLLTAGEMLDLQLQAELVVLSACDTGRGKITGDGVIGLSRSLISAGVPSVVVSLWAVDDGATSELMQVFYQQLQQPGMDKAQALRQAMLATRAKHPGVAYWAAFTLIGEAE